MILVKTALAVAALVVLFGGGFVAVHKPFRAGPALTILGAGALLLVAAFTTGWIRFACIGTLLVMLVALPFIARRK